jgi:hypothetical protein
LGLFHFCSHPDAMNAASTKLMVYPFGLGTSASAKAVQVLIGFL